MTFDNSKTIINLRLKLFAATVLVITYMVLAYIAKIIKFPVFGLSDSTSTIIVITLYIIVVLYPVVLNHQYVKYSDEGDFIVFRYFTSGIFGGKKNSVEILKTSFVGYKTEKSYLGLNQSIILFQQFKEGMAKYPPIYISGLSRKDRVKILNSLDNLSPRK